MAKATISFRNADKNDPPLVITAKEGIAMTILGADDSAVFRLHYHTQNSKEVDYYTPVDCVHSIEIKNDNGLPEEVVV